MNNTERNEAGNTGISSMLEGTKNILCCLEEEIYSPVSYLRVIRHLQDLKPGHRTAVFVLPGQLPEALEQIPRASLVIMARSRHEASRQAAQRAAACGVPILCDLDDYVWEFPDYSKVDRHNTHFTDDVLTLAACVATPSERLGQTVREKHPDKAIRSLPNAGNIWSDAAPAFVPCVMANSDFFRMPEMKSEFFRALRDAAREAGQSLLLYYFSNDPPEHFTDDPHLRVVWMGFRSYSSYRQLLDHLRPAFGLVVLREEEFSRHKSVIKFAEYGFAGTIGLYSRVEPYAGFIEDGETGFFADNTYEGWKATVLRALRLERGDRQRTLDRIGRAVKEQFDYEKIHEAFCALVAEHALAGPADPAFRENLPDLEAFAFREAYAYAAWVMHVEKPSLLQQLEQARRAPPPPAPGLWARLAAWAQRKPKE